MQGFGHGIHGRVNGVDALFADDVVQGGGEACVCVHGYAADVVVIHKAAMVIHAGCANQGKVGGMLHGAMDFQPDF